MMKIATIALASGSGAQTNTALIAADATRQLRVFGVYASSDAQIVLTLENSAGHEDLYIQYLAADGGQVNVSPHMPFILPTWGEGLDYTTSGAANLWITVLYDFA